MSKGFIVNYGLNTAVALLLSDFIIQFQNQFQDHLKCITTYLLDKPFLQQEL